MGREEVCPLEIFQRDVAQHEMTIIRDDGKGGRHLRFGRPQSSSYYFNLITFPGGLLIDGDCGSYVFKRLPDMFEFFRAGGSHPDAINPQYWAEKVVAADPHGGVEKFSWETFKADVAEHLESAFDDDDKHLGDHVKEDVRADLMHIEEDEFGAVGFIRDFRCRGWHFQDWERQSKEFTFRYIWNLRAIVWAIAKYDALKAAGREAANDDGSERVAA